MKELDLDQLRKKVAEKADPESIVTVSRRFLEQVEREITAGRVAAAQLQQHLAVAGLIDGLANGVRT